MVLFYSGPQLKTKIYGFTLLRNGIKYDYSYIECLKNLSLLVDKIYLALGESDDGTFESLKDFENIEFIHTKWDPALMGDGGQILSQQTNVALEKLREDLKDDPEFKNAWGMYLQCDEMIHEDEIERIKHDIEYANEQGHDAVRFRYLHFWKDHYHIAINKRWYPQEVRAIKLDSKILSFGDAQGFSDVTNPYESDCKIFHYGHVRDEEKLAEKQKQLIRFIRPAEKFNKYFNREKKAFSKTKTVRVNLKHPRVMKERIERMGEKYDLDLPTKNEPLYILGNSHDFDTSLVKNISASEVKFVSSKSEVPRDKKDNLITLENTFIKKILGTSLPDSMESPFAREWDKNFKLLISLSKRGFYLK